jgi:signal transduction histidine kinase
MSEEDERWRIPGGLRTQLLAGLVVLVVGTVALVALVVLHLAEQEIRRSEIRQTIRSAEHLADLNLGEVPDERVRSFRRRADVRFAHLTIGEQTFRSGWLPGVSNGEAIERLDPSSSSYRFLDLDDRTFVLAAVRVHRAGEPTTAYVARSFERAQHRIRRTQTLLGVYLGLDALFILIVGYAFLTYVVVRPIRAIGTATDRAARGDLASHIEVLPANEYGDVGRSFNRMLDELRNNRRELEERLEELDRAYTELEQTQESLIRSEKLASVGQLAAGVAHEVGNPLSSISGYADMMADMDLEEDEYRDLAERIGKQVDRIQQIIHQLLDYSRDDSREPIEAVSLSDGIDEALDLLEPQPRMRRKTIETTLPDDLPDVRGNANQIVQVLVNLLINAADAINGASEREYGEGRIELEAGVDEADDEVWLRVSDDGPGIPEEDRSRIFDPFFTTKEPGEGTGLGLAISHRIVHRFDGNMSVESQVGEGTTFELRFQRDDDAR